MLGFKHKSSCMIIMDLLKSYFASNPYFITKHHIESFDDFVFQKIPNVLKSMNPFTILKQENKQLKHTIDVYVGGEDGSDIFIDKPQNMLYDSSEVQAMLPNDARLRNKTYASDVFVTILLRYTIYDTHVNAKGVKKVLETFDHKLTNIKLFTLPVMLHSSLCILHNQPKEKQLLFGECPYDQGGYFIVDGKEKVIVAQERNVTNRLFINKVKDQTSQVKTSEYTYTGFMKCTNEESSVFPKTIRLFVMSSNVASGKRTNAILISVPHIDTLIPVAILFRALGVETDKAILEHVMGMDIDNIDTFNSLDTKIIDFFRHSLVDGNTLFTKEDAWDYLAPHTEYKSPENVQYILYDNLFPNIAPDMKQRALFLGFICNKLVKTCIGVLDEINRDNYMYKRVGLSGSLMADVFKDFYNEFRNHVRNSIDREYELTIKGKQPLEKLVTFENVKRIFDHTIISNGLRKSLKGQWGIIPDPAKAGIVQDLNRMSYMASCSHLRRVNTPLSDAAKVVDPHRLNGSQWGVMCPCESPDGRNIGLLKNFALLCHVSPERSIAGVLSYVSLFNIKRLVDCKVGDMKLPKLLINNTLYAVIIDNVSTLVTLMKLLKRCGLLDPLTSIVWDVVSNEVYISTDSGRCCRPLIVCQGLKSTNITDSTIQMPRDWTRATMHSQSNFDKIKARIKDMTDPKQLIHILSVSPHFQLGIEYLDVEETNTSLIAMEMPTGNANGYTHCEIHPATIFSVYTATIPLSNHNQAPRNIFSGAQGKQAVGVYATNFNNRMDTMSYVLHYPQKPLVTTQLNTLVNGDKLPNGENLIVAVMSYTGYNQEDSIMINAGSIERGAFNVSYFKTHVFEEEQNEITGHMTSGDSQALGGQAHASMNQTYFGNPIKTDLWSDKVELKNYGNYETLEESGFPKKGLYLEEGDMLLGKIGVVVDATTNQSKYLDKSVKVDKTNYGIVDQVFVEMRPNKTRLCKIRMKKIRIPELGDKLASRHGQKGVVGMVIPQEDMPFTQSGLVPDIIINPHAFPSRMTIGHIIESVVAKICTVQGHIYDATPFEPHDFEGVYDHAHGKFERHGNEIMWSGRTGEQIGCEIFIGPTYYYRLKHMVSDKINYRSQGKRVKLTNQPTQGRSNEGGMRIGEMERDAILSHGAMSFIKESYMERSDKSEMIVRDNITDTPVMLQVPQSFKLFANELKTFGIEAQLVTTIDPDDPNDPNPYSD